MERDLRTRIEATTKEAEARHKHELERHSRLNDEAKLRRHLLMKDRAEIDKVGFIELLTTKVQEAARAGQRQASIEVRTRDESQSDQIDYTMTAVKDHFVNEGFTAEAYHRNNAHVTGPEGYETLTTTEWWAGVRLSWPTEV